MVNVWHNFLTKQGKKKPQKTQHSCWMLQCASLHQEGRLTEWDIVYFWAMKLQAGKPKAVARCDWCNQGLLGQTRRRAPAFPLVNHGAALWDKNNRRTEDKWPREPMHTIYNNRLCRSQLPKTGEMTGRKATCWLTLVKVPGCCWRYRPGFVSAAPRRPRKHAHRSQGLPLMAASVIL